MHTDMYKDGMGRTWLARMMEVLGSRFQKKPEGLEIRLEPLSTESLVRPSMHHRVTIQTHHEDWP